ncbi:MAG: hypothetical protein II074_01650 [Ruminococcus sp.]|nr:hypothetical protein [Ruminococcus sp.]
MTAAAVGSPRPLPRWAVRDRFRGGQSVTADVVGSPRPLTLMSKETDIHAL